ncbi:hypothetical protein CQA53_05280 [Helicobacter didelphidarum]|uniref:Uracil-DNA glycosylase-like domain-containing protein n=1 Tax=Helicobacter didelphidarum TaxID=2040648 RepID=A0A3D8ILN5_9HELI|nr:uracil-DNA glycosylase family protein [Helicobacter didelphidarum]RDU65865.1 hypothetical protein CQA53_05280 [Helicobacter didelphidarum]
MIHYPFLHTQFHKDSRILILGSFPSVSSRKLGFYYQHPQNRFWKVLYRIFSQQMPYDTNTTKLDIILPCTQFGNPKKYLFATSQCIDSQSTIAQQKAFLQIHNIVLWDIIKSCEIIGSSDTSIKNIIPNDIRTLLAQTNIDIIALNGNKAGKIFAKIYHHTIDHAKDTHFYRILTPKNHAYTLKPNLKIFLLPSTSPANARFGLENLIESWCIIATKK